MNEKGIILQASSRSNGNTAKVVSYLKEQTNFDVVDLATLQIKQFDYDFQNQDDDFAELIQKLANDYDTIIFATPVYWYTMSGLLKVFLDRISDCLINDKGTARKFQGKSLGLLISSSDAALIEGFDRPIIGTANYLGMEYLGSLHTWIENNEIPEGVEQQLDVFSERIVKKRQTENIHE